MKIRLKTMWNGLAAGRELELGAGQVQLLIQRGIAEVIEDSKRIDPDKDGKAEGGIFGEKKAFTRPPQGKGRR